MEATCVSKLADKKFVAYIYNGVFYYSTIKNGHLVSVTTLGSRIILSEVNKRKIPWFYFYLECEKMKTFKRENWNEIIIQRTNWWLTEVRGLGGPVDRERGLKGTDFQLSNK